MLSTLLLLRAEAAQKRISATNAILLPLLEKIHSGCLAAAAQGRGFWDGALELPEGTDTGSCAYLTGILSRYLSADKTFPTAEAAYHHGDKLVRVYVGWAF